MAMKPSSKFGSMNAVDKSKGAGAKEFYRSMASSVNRGTKPFMPGNGEGREIEPSGRDPRAGKTAADIRRTLLKKKAAK
jgi:hypothetical protein